MKGERLGEFEELVLLTLAGMREDESYVVPILERLEEEAERIVPIGAVYSALDRLHRKGMVRSWVAGGEKRGRGRRKRYYAVNEDGMAALDESRRIREHLWQTMLRTTPEGSPA